MEFLKYKLTKTDNMAIFDFSLDENIEPYHLKEIKLPDPVKENVSSKVIVISGRGPIWLYGFFIHHFHPCKAVAVFDPRLDGAVIIESHSKEFTIGDVISIKYEGDRLCQKQSLYK